MQNVTKSLEQRLYGAMLQDFWDGLLSESRRNQKGIPFEKIKADLIKRGRPRE
jgi:hypothetical protein